MVEGLKISHSEQLGQLATALAKVQSTIKDPDKKRVASIPTKGGGKYTYNYADLSDVLACCRPLLSKNDIAVMQSPSVASQEMKTFSKEGQPYETVGSSVSLDTMLIHKSGEWIRGNISLCSTETKAQSIGSLITYLRRYSLSSMVGVFADEDNDANVADNTGATTNSRNTKQGASKGPPLKEAYDHNNNMHKSIVKGWWSQRSEQNPGETDEEKKAIWAEVAGKTLGEIKTALGV